ncbi:hypothetical protein GCM10010384_21480 [Streptomyces djakartensis]|uniref:Transposase n=1 Tax=Streptomyces djakartensis TaxID=68193 RepID=A0ABQ2ZFS1_9ACTN|nr:hypothetical protein GCM10010384_21480 [Streptomyces djakartensis]
MCGDAQRFVAQGDPAGSVQGGGVDHDMRMLGWMCHAFRLLRPALIRTPKAPALRQLFQRTEVVARCPWRVSGQVLG